MQRWGSEVFGPEGVGPEGVGPRLQTPPKFHERTPRRERRKKENCGGRGKNSEFLGCSGEWRVPGSEGSGGGPGEGGSGRTNSPEALRGMLGGNWQPPEVTQPTKMGHSHEILRKATNIWRTTAKVCTTASTRVWPKSNWPKSNWPKSNWPKSSTTVTGDPEVGLGNFAQGVRIGVGARLPRLPELHKRRKQWRLPSQSDPQDYLENNDGSKGS